MKFHVSPRFLHTSSAGHPRFPSVSVVVFAPRVDDPSLASIDAASLRVLTLPPVLSVLPFAPVRVVPREAVRGRPPPPPCGHRPESHPRARVTLEPPRAARADVVVVTALDDISTMDAVARRRRRVTRAPPSRPNSSASRRSRRATGGGLEASHERSRGHRYRSVFLTGHDSSIESLGCVPRARLDARARVRATDGDARDRAERVFARARTRRYVRSVRSSATNSRARANEREARRRR